MLSSSMFAPSLPMQEHQQQPPPQQQQQHSQYLDDWQESLNASFSNLAQLPDSSLPFLMSSEVEEVFRTVDSMNEPLTWQAGFDAGPSFSSLSLNSTPLGKEGMEEESGYQSLSPCPLPDISQSVLFRRQGLKNCKSINDFSTVMEKKLVYMNRGRRRSANDLPKLRNPRIKQISDSQKRTSLVMMMENKDESSPTQELETIHNINTSRDRVIHKLRDGIASLEASRAMRTSSPSPRSIISDVETGSPYTPPSCLSPASSLQHLS